MGRVRWGLAWVVFLLWAASPVEAAVLKVFVSIAPQKYFVEKIGGDRVAVSVLVPPGADPHHFEPKPRQMAELAKTPVYFAIGVELEKVWLKKIAAANPKLRIVHTDDGIAKIVSVEQGHHGETPPASHVSDRAPGKSAPREAALDPHIWLSPPLVKIQAGKIREGLIAVDPLHRSGYEANYAAFLKEIDALDAELKAVFAGRRGKQFMVLHPSWGYFAAAYGLEQVSIEIEGKEPKPAQLQTLIRHAREHRIGVIFVQPQFSAKSAELLAREIGGRIVVADPMAEDWAANLHTVGRKFGAAIR